MNDAKWRELLESAIFPVAISSMIAGLTVPTGRSWMANGWIGYTEKDRLAARAGETTHLTGRRVLEMSIGAALTAFKDLKPAFACAVARKFTDTPTQTREHGFLAGQGHRTFLVFYPGDPRLAKVVDFKLSSSGADLLGMLTPLGHSRSALAGILELEPIVIRVQSELAKYSGVG